MKKILGLLLLTSSLFSMDLAYKLQTPYNRFNRVKSAVVKNHKSKIAFAVSHVGQTVSNTIDTPKVQIDASSVRAPHRLGVLELYYGKKGFVVLHDDKKHVIEKCFMDPIARSITKEQLKPFLKTGYFAINQTNDGTFTLKAHHRLLGGGPIFGKIMYWATKVVCYAVLTAAAGAIVISGGSVGVGVVKGAKGVKVGMTTAKAAKVAATTTATVQSLKVVTAMAQSTAGSLILNEGLAATITQASGAAIFAPATVNNCMLGSGAVAAGIVKLGGAPTCAKVVGAGLATGSSGTGIVAGIETVSLAVGIFCGLTPTP